jgi:hypothetical protein
MSQQTYDETFAATVKRQGLLPALLSGRPSPAEKRMLKQARREATRRSPYGLANKG